MFLFFFLARFPFSLVLLILRGGGWRSFSRPRKRYASSTHENRCKKSMSAFVSVFHSAAPGLKNGLAKKASGATAALVTFSQRIRANLRNLLLTATLSWLQQLQQRLRR